MRALSIAIPPVFFALALSSVLALSSFPAPSGAGVQDGPPPPAPPPQQGQGQGQGNSQVVPVNQTVIDLLARQIESQGGIDRMQALRVVAFDLKLATAIDGEWTEQPPMSIALERGDPPRRTRIDDTLEGRKLVKFTNDREVRVFVDGVATELPDLVAGAKLESALLAETIEFILSLGFGRVAVGDEGVKRRDGADYHALRVRMEGGTERLMELFLDRETGLPQRLDVFHPGTGRRVESGRFQGYAKGTGPKLPAELVFTDRDGKPLSRWRLLNVRFDPELAAGFFEQP